MTGAMDAKNICLPNRKIIMMILMLSQFENMMKRKLMINLNKLPVQKNVQSSRKKSVPDSLQNFSPNPGTCKLYTWNKFYILAGTSRYTIYLIWYAMLVHFICRFYMHTMKYTNIRLNYQNTQKKKEIDDQSKDVHSTKIDWRSDFV